MTGLEFDRGLDAAPLHLSEDGAMRMLALTYALKYHDTAIIKDGQMYQIKKAEGVNFRTITEQIVIETAIAFEVYLRGKYAPLVDAEMEREFITKAVDEAVAELERRAASSPDGTDQ